MIKINQMELLENLDSKLANRYGWKSRTTFEKGIRIVVNDYLKNNISKFS